MSVATGSNFIEGGGTVDDPFAAGARPLTLQEQAALEEQRRQQRLQEQATRAANVNSRPGGFMSERETRPGQQIDPKTGKPYTGKERPKVDNSLSGILQTGNELVEDHPWVVAMPLAPLGGAALAPGAAGAGSISAAGGTAAPAITTGGAVTEATIAAPVAAGAATGSTVPAAAGTAAGASAFDKYGVPALTAAAPLAINAVTGGRTKEEKALLQKQEQMAREAEARRFQVQESRMNALGQQLLAFNPRNQMMAQMFGPGAAFAPTDFAQMVQNPTPPPQLPPELQALAGKTTKNTPQQEAALRAFAQQKQQYEQGNQARSDQMMNGMAPPGPGPTPLQQRTPQPARKY